MRHYRAGAEIFDICRGLPGVGRGDCRSVEGDRMLVRSGQPLRCLRCPPPISLPNLDDWQSEAEFNAAAGQ